MNKLHSGRNLNGGFPERNNDRSFDLKYLVEITTRIEQVKLFRQSRGIKHRASDYTGIRIYENTFELIDIDGLNFDDKELKEFLNPGS